VKTVSGPAKFWGEYIVQEVPSGTLVRKMGQIRLGGLLRMADLLAAIFQEALKQDMGKPETTARTAGSPTRGNDSDASRRTPGQGTAD